MVDAVAVDQLDHRILRAYGNAAVEVVETLFAVVVCDAAIFAVVESLVD